MSRNFWRNRRKSSGGRRRRSKTIPARSSSPLPFFLLLPPSGEAASKGSGGRKKREKKKKKRDTQKRSMPLPASLACLGAVWMFGCLFPLSDQCSLPRLPLRGLCWHGMAPTNNQRADERASGCQRHHPSPLDPPSLPFSSFRSLLAWLAPLTRTEEKRRESFLRRWYGISRHHFPHT